MIAEGIHCELRAAVGQGFPVPPNVSHITERRQGYEGETPLNEYRCIPTVTGTYQEVMAEACERNAAFMPYQMDGRSEAVIPIRYYPHPVPKTA